MPSLTQHQSNQFTKLLLIGDSGTGKTGALTSLVAAGYKLRILDFDNGLETLKQFVLKECPDKMGNIEYRTLRDNRKAGPTGSIIEPTSFINGLRMLDTWKYKYNGEVIDYGPPAKWGPDCVFVLDSLTFMSDAAYNFREPLAAKSRDGKFDARAVYKDAQDAVEDVLAQLNSDQFETNVIVIAHIKYMERPDGSTKGYPTTVGSALSPNVPTYFNTVAQCVTNPGGKRVIQTTATAMIDLKNPKPFEISGTYPIASGLATIFKELRSEAPQIAPEGAAHDANEEVKEQVIVKPKALQLRRR